MATMSMTASFLLTNTMLPSTASHRGLPVVKAPSQKTNLEANLKDRQENNNAMRRDLLFAGAALAACSLAKVAMADDEPKAGTPEAKKKYAPVCVTMPTARVCRN